MQNAFATVAGLEGAGHIVGESRPQLGARRSSIPCCVFISHFFAPRVREIAAFAKRGDSMDKETRSELLRKAQQGDEGALGTLLQGVRPFLRILARRHLDSALAPRVDPSDIVQQVCLEVHRDLSNFRGDHEREFIGWIRRILENNARDCIQMHISAQKRSIYREGSCDPQGEDAVASMLGMPEKQPSPSSRLMRDEMAVRIAAEIERLPEDQREAVRLRHLEGWSLKDLASYFDRSESAVAGLLKRGLRSLRKQLADVE